MQVNFMRPSRVSSLPSSLLLLVWVRRIVDLNLELVQCIGSKRWLMIAMTYSDQIWCWFQWTLDMMNNTAAF